MRVRLLPDLTGTTALLSAMLVLLLGGCQSDRSSSQSEAKKPRPVQKDSSRSASLTSQDLIEASLNGDMKRVRRAVEQEGVQVNASDRQGNTPLMMAAYNGHRDVVSYLLDHGARIDARNAQGRTALMFAATGPFPATVALLLERGADPNATDNAEKWSPLMFAAAEGNREVVQRLLDHGADAMRKDRDGETARNFAEKNNHSAVVELLTNRQ